MKRIISILLTVVLVLASTCMVSASYTKETAAEELEKYGIVDRNALGQLTVDGPVTRAGMTKMIILMLGLKPAENSSGFTDVPCDHWASGYIAQAKNLGIIDGMGDGTFAPDEYVTYEQAMKMVICALGWGESARRQGRYPMGYAITATYLGLSPSKARLSDYADRGDIMIMLAKALDVPLSVLSSFGENTQYTVLDGKNGKEFRSLRTQLDK